MAKEKVTTPTKAQVSAAKAARTRAFKHLDEQVASGIITTMQAAGYKSRATAKLNKVLTASNNSAIYA